MLRGNDEGEGAFGAGAFLVAEDRDTGRIAGFLNGLATKERKFRDAFFTDAGLHDPNGDIVMLLGLDVLPEYRGRGLARKLMSVYAARERRKGREALLLTCLESKVRMYEKMGFQDKGLSGSSWGGETWHECVLFLNDGQSTGAAADLHRGSKERQMKFG